MALRTFTSGLPRVTSVASRRFVHAALAWLHTNPKTILDWQIDLSTIPGPPFGEGPRADWIAARFQEIGLEQITRDAIGNVVGVLPARGLSAESTGPLVVLSAHLDTVFPAGTEIRPNLRVLDGNDRVECPGICDNGTGVVGMLAIAQALMSSQAELPCPLLFVANVGEEGEGDLRGIRHLYETAPLAGRIAAHIVLDGAGCDSAVTQALGSRRFTVTITGPGGHSFTDAGTPNPIAALATTLSTLAVTPLPEEPRTTLNLGTIQGGTSVNSIPEFATASIDFRSTSMEELVRLEVALHRAVEDAVDHWNSFGASPSRPRPMLAYTVKKIGDRPAAMLPDNSPMLESLRAVDRHLGIATSLRLGSTDANIPLSLGVPSLSMGAGGEGGGAHTLAEWYAPKDREAGLRRVLLLTLVMLDWAAEQ